MIDPNTAGLSDDPEIRARQLEDIAKLNRALQEPIARINRQLQEDLTTRGLLRGIKESYVGVARMFLGRW